MITEQTTTIRQAQSTDRQQLNNLIQFETYVHRHLDWRRPVDWIGHNPYLVIQEKDRLVAALACPPDPPEVAWVRVFATTASLPVQKTWDKLWGRAKENLQRNPNIHIAALCIDNWFRKLLENSNFVHAHNVVLLAWDHSQLPPLGVKFDGKLRRTISKDLPAIQKLDQAAFKPVWRNSLPSLQLAIQKASVATTAENEKGEIVGYQISTSSPLGGHLARLAVNPSAQGQGVGYALVRDLLEKFKEKGALRVTVNTQHDNQISLSLYEKAGFKRTGEEYPVYIYHPN